MYQTLASILDNYSVEEKLLDKEALEEVAKVEIEQNSELAIYLKDVVILPNGENKTYASYDIENKIIKFYLEYSYTLLSYRYDAIDYRKKNEILMQIILHEIKHAKQILQAFSVGDNIEQEIIRASILLQINEAYYLKNSKICPLERLAEIDSLSQMMLIVRERHATNERYYFTKINEILHSGYSRSLKNNPTEKYIKNGLTDFCFALSRKKLKRIKQELTLEERLRLGLSITKKEFDQTLEPNETLIRILK